MLNLLIVDDEDTIRYGLTKAVDWESLGFNIVDTAANGVMALELIKTREIDVVLTDIRMPKMSGLELAAAILEGYPDIKVIILSGYSDFAYAQQAIKNNVFDYILKPSKEAEIIRVFTRLKEVIEKEKKNKAMIAESQADMVQNLMIKIVADSDTKPEGIATTLGGIFPGLVSDRKVVLTLQVNMDVPCRDEYRNVELKSYNLYLRNILNHLEQYSIPVFSVKNSQISMVISDPDVQKLFEAAAEIYRLVENSLKAYSPNGMGVSVTGGVSEPYNNLGETRAYFIQSSVALKHIVYLGKNRLIRYNDIKSNVSSIPEIQYAEVSSRIITNLYSRNFDRAAAISLEIFESLKACKVYSRDLLFITCYNLLHQINEGLKNHGMNGEKILGPSELLLNTVKELETIDEIEQYFRDMIYRCNDSFQDHEQDSIRKIIESAVIFMKENYTKDISLEILSKRFNISQAYFCRLFKKELGVNFKDYLIELRLEKAKELLLSSEMKIYEVAGIVGYEDQRYFSELFKCKVGLTPLEYREKAGR